MDLREEDEVKKNTHTIATRRKRFIIRSFFFHFFLSKEKNDKNKTKKLHAKNCFLIDLQIKTKMYAKIITL